MDLQNESALNVLTALIWGEARGETAIGKLAVGCVVRNRTIDKRWPDTYQEVILQPYQFSSFNSDDPNYKTTLDALRPSCNGNWGDIAWRECRWAAQSIIGHHCQDFTHGANHYYATNIKTPYWVAGVRPSFMWGPHFFYSL